MLPEGWEKKKFGCVAELQRGFDLPQAHRHNGIVPVISSAGRTGYHNVAKASAPGIVTGRYGSIGDVFYVEEPFWPLNTSLWVKDFHGNNEKFIFYVLTKFDFSKFSDKTGVPGVNRNDLHAVTVCVPPLPEQKKIAAILSTWDRAIEVTEKLLANSQQQKKALMQQLLTGKKRLPGFTGEWTSSSLGAIGKWAGGGTPSKSDDSFWIGGTIPWVSPKDMKSEKICETEDYITIDAVIKSSARVYPEGSVVVVTRSGILRKRLPVALASQPFAVNQDMKVLEKSSKFCSEFIQNLIIFNNKEILEKSYKDGTTVESIDTSAFLGFKISLPNILEQKAIATVLIKADEEVTLLKSDLIRLRQEKKALMQQLLTGKRRVKIEADAG